MTPSDQRSGYKYFVDITTRWMDNDIYGHVNNVVYYSYFDSVANQYLIEQGGLDIHSAEIIGFVVASSCEYKSPVAYPDKLEAGFRVNRLGHLAAAACAAAFAVAHGAPSATRGTQSGSGRKALP